MSSFIKDIGMDEENRPTACLWEYPQSVHQIELPELFKVFYDINFPVLNDEMECFLSSLQKHGFIIIKKEREND